MKRYIIILIGCLLISCAVQREPLMSESEKLAQKQYYVFFNWMLFGEDDQSIAVESLFNSANAGYVESQNLLGGCYAERPDLIQRDKPNIDSALIWWHKAAEQNEWMAQRDLAYYYTEKNDWKQAKFWLKRAKKNGYKDKELQKRINKHL